MYNGEVFMVRTIEPQAFDLELQSSDEPLLVAFLKRNERYADQAEILEKTSQSHKDRVRCFLYDSDYLDTAQERFAVKGTPTFLLFDKGQEVDRLIGESDGETLDDFIRGLFGE